MTNFALDTSIASEVFQQQNGHVLNWLEDTPDEHLYLPMPAAGELYRYVALESMSAAEIAARRARLDRIFSRFSLLEADLPVFLHWGLMTANVTGGRSRLAIDALIAATGMAHDMVVATTNMRDFNNFTRFGVRLYDPSSYQRPDPA
ncbi:MAG: PIN domain-containing protein [Anaerolineaceae bacterium]|nr:PIN domain-containing protein [Anaerolineaceae bacterium]